MVVSFDRNQESNTGGDPVEEKQEMKFVVNGVNGAGNTDQNYGYCSCCRNSEKLWNGFHFRAVVLMVTDIEGNDLRKNGQ